VREPAHTSTAAMVPSMVAQKIRVAREGFGCPPEVRMSTTREAESELVTKKVAMTRAARTVTIAVSQPGTGKPCSIWKRAVSMDPATASTIPPPPNSSW